MLEVVSPHPLTLLSIDMLVDTNTVCFAVCQLAIINVTISVNEFAYSISSVLTPLTDVPGSIRPYLLTEAVTELALPLAGVYSSCLERVRCSLLPPFIRIKLL
jgi:hypothetical protein